MPTSRSKPAENPVSATTYIVTVEVPSPAEAELIKLVAMEVSSVAAKHPLYNSAHEGFGVLAEEVDELWDEVRKKRSKRSVSDMTKECVQIASCAVRFALSMQRQEQVAAALKKLDRTVTKGLRKVEKAKASAKSRKTRSEF